MSGHSKWSKVKHQKAVEDIKKGQLFSKIIKEISAQARIHSDPQVNSALKALIDKARGMNVPKEHIERAILRAQEKAEIDGEAFLLEVWAKNGQGLIINGRTDNKNRTLSEIKHIIRKYEAKLVGPGGVSWNFEGEKPKTTKPMTPDFQKLLDELNEYPDVTHILIDAV